MAGRPTCIAFTPDGKLAYVADDLAGQVTPIKPATGTAEPPITVASSNGVVGSIVVVPRPELARAG